MTINPIQTKIDNTKSTHSLKKREIKSYLEATGAINTSNNVKPLPPKGHLIHDNFSNSVKYFFKDKAYDMKSLKNAYLGTANDHQSGRLNDIGMVGSGILIATYLASKTTNPKARIMEYLGLGAFLTSMSLFPKLFINLPAKLMHGYDIDKEYIDDQGRKKSVMQDSNYVPYDMYLGSIPEEDLDVIGDEMGIPRVISDENGNSREVKNRHQLIKEQMRKEATQSNTLWMLMAGVTPAMAGLLCYGIENYIVAPGLEKSRSIKYQKAITEALNHTKNMDLDVSKINSNSLSRKVESILKGYNGEIPTEELDNLIAILTKNLDSNLSEGIKDDITRILESASSGEKSIIISGEDIGELVKLGEKSLTGRNKDAVNKIIVPTKEEMEQIFKQFAKDGDLTKTSTTSEKNIVNIKNALIELINAKIEKETNIPKEFLQAERNNFVNKIASSLKTKKSMTINDTSRELIINMAKILGDFEANKILLNKCKSFNFEDVPESILARYYNKFENAVLKELDIKYSDLKKVRDSGDYAQELLNEKFEALCKDEKRYSKAMKTLGKIISEMESKLHGEKETESFVLDLINAIENNYNNTAKRLNSLGSFESTIRQLVNQDVNTLTNSITSKQELFDFLDGIETNKLKELIDSKGGFHNLSYEEKMAYLKEHYNAVGSSKKKEITRLLERYQGVKNSFHRILHTMEIYRRTLNPTTFAENLKGKDPKYIEKIIAEARKTLLTSTVSNHMLMLNTINNPEYYKDLMLSILKQGEGNQFSTKHQSFVTDIAKDSLESVNDLKTGNVLSRFRTWLTKQRILLTNNNMDFMKPFHRPFEWARDLYKADSKTASSLFNLVGQNPLDMLRGSAKRKYSNQKWFRTVSAVTATILGATVLAQIKFGKISNPENIQMQVNDDTTN